MWMWRWRRENIWLIIRSRWFSFHATSNFNCSYGPQILSIYFCSLGIQVFNSWCIALQTNGYFDRLILMLMCLTINFSINEIERKVHTRREGEFCDKTHCYVKLNSMKYSRPRTAHIAYKNWFTGYSKPAVQSDYFECLSSKRERKKSVLACKCT